MSMKRWAGWLSETNSQTLFWIRSVDTGRVSKKGLNGYKLLLAC